MKRGPKPAVMTDAEVAIKMELPERLVRARARFSFFAGASEDPDRPGCWLIPRSAVEDALRLKVQNYFSIQKAARILDVGYSTFFRETAVVAKLDDPLPPGKSVRAVFLFFGRGKPLKRIPESELLRLQGGAKAA